MKILWFRCRFWTKNRTTTWQRTTSASRRKRSSVVSCSRHRLRTPQTVNSSKWPMSRWTADWRSWKCSHATPPPRWRWSNVLRSPGSSRRCATPRKSPRTRCSAAKIRWASGYQMGVWSSERLTFGLFQAKQAKEQERTERMEQQRKERELKNQQALEVSVWKFCPKRVWPKSRCLFKFSLSTTRRGTQPTSFTVVPVNNLCSCHSHVSLFCSVIPI